MKRSGRISPLILKIIFWSFLVLFLLTAFLSDRTLKILFSDKIWAHKVNSIEKLGEVNGSFTGAELDVVYHAENNYFEVNHPPDPSANLSLVDYFLSQKSNHDFHYWIDLKNLIKNNAVASSSLLDSIVRSCNIDKSQVIVESGNQQYLKSYRDNGFLTSYYLPAGLHGFNDDSLKPVLEKIRMNLDLHENYYMSADYQDYPLIKKQFPERKKLIWYTLQGNLNIFSSRILLYQILLDENVDVLLIPYHTKHGSKKDS